MSGLKKVRAMRMGGVALIGGLVLATIGGTVAGNATVAGMASRSDYGLPSDGTDLAASATAGDTEEWAYSSPDCAGCASPARPLLSNAGATSETAQAGIYIR